MGPLAVAVDPVLLGQEHRLHALLPLLRLCRERLAQLEQHGARRQGRRPAEGAGRIRQVHEGGGHYGVYVHPRLMTTGCEKDMANSFSPQSASSPATPIGTAPSTSAASRTSTPPTSATRTSPRATLSTASGCGCSATSRTSFSPSPPPTANQLTLCLSSFEWWQNGAPRHEPTLVSRLVTSTYWRRQCPLLFPPSEAGPEGYGIINGARARDVNRRTGGWNALNTTRAMHTNGGLDPWRDATLSSQSRPGGPFEGSEKLPVRVVKGGVHCSDLYGPNWEVDEGVRRLKGEVVSLSLIHI